MNALLTGAEDFVPVLKDRDAWVRHLDTRILTTLPAFRVTVYGMKGSSLALNVGHARATGTCIGAQFSGAVSLRSTKTKPKSRIANPLASTQPNGYLRGSLPPREFEYSGADIDETDQQSLRESEERFRQVVENIDEVFWMTELEKNKMLFISSGYEKV